MKKLLFGNEAIALGAIRAGVSLAAAYPGVLSSEILKAVAQKAAPSGSGISGGSSAVYVEWSVNERAAVEVAAGAAICGSRSLVAMMRAGLNGASDSLASLNRMGVSGGLVVVVVDDPAESSGALSSRNGEDTRHFARYAKLAVFDPSGPEEAYLMTADAFDYSEKRGRPVIVRPTAGICRAYASVDLDALSLPARPRVIPDAFNKDSIRRFVFPGFDRKNHETPEADMAKAGDDFAVYRGNALFTAPDVSGSENGESLPGASGRLGIASGGTSFASVMDILNPLPPGLKVLKAGTFPFPEEMALRFLENLDEVLVLEELDPVIEDELLRLCGGRRLSTEIMGKRSGYMPRSGEYSPAMIAEKTEAFLRKVWTRLSDLEETPGGADENLPEFGSLAPLPPEALAAAGTQSSPPAIPELAQRRPVFCAGCPRRASFHAVEEAVRKYGRGREAVFAGELACYVLGGAPPDPKIIDASLCTGSGITLAQGIGRVDGRFSFAFIDDAAFFHTGIPGLVNAVRNRSDIITVVLDNGNRSRPGAGADAGDGETEKISIPALAAALGIKEIVRLNPFDPESSGAAIGQLLDKTGVRLVIFEGACVTQREEKSRSFVDPEKCTGCKTCVEKPGCPALLSGEDGGSGKALAATDSGLCAGCGIRGDICSSGAFGPEEADRGF